MKKTEKKTTKKFKPDFTVDLTTAEDSADVCLAFALGRFDAGKPLTQNDLDIIVAATADCTAEMIFDMQMCTACIFRAMMKAAEEKLKMPWYKRLWKKIKGLFTRK